MLEYSQPYCPQCLLSAVFLQAMGMLFLSKCGRAERGLRHEFHGRSPVSLPPHTCLRDRDAKPDDPTHNTRTLLLEAGGERLTLTLTRGESLTLIPLSFSKLQVRGAYENFVVVYFITGFVVNYFLAAALRFLVAIPEYGEYALEANMVMEETALHNDVEDRAKGMNADVQVDEPTAHTTTQDLEIAVSNTG